MRTTSHILACFLTIAAATTASALTSQREVTLAYVREHPDEFSVSVTKGKAGLIDFTITHNVATPMYHVAHLAIYRGGRFHFSIAAEDISECKFSLSDGALAGSGDDAVPVPGTIIHQFRLSDFIPKELVNG